MMMKNILVILSLNNFVWTLVGLVFTCICGFGVRNYSENRTIWNLSVSSALSCRSSGFQLSFLLRIIEQLFTSNLIDMAMLCFKYCNSPVLYSA